MSSISLRDLNTPREITLEFVRVVLSRKIQILLVFVTTVLSAYTYLQLMTERYQAEATLLVMLGRENAELPVSVSRGTVTSLGVRQEEINSNVSLLQSRFLVEEVIDEMGLEAFAFEPPEPTNWLEEIKYRVKSTVRWVKKQYQELLILAKLEKRLTDRQQTIDYVHKFLEVARVRESDAIRVAVSLPDPELAKTFLEHLLDSYFERHVSVRSMALSEDFFEKQVELFRTELDTLDESIVALRSSRDLSAVDRQRDLLLGRLAKISEELDENRSQLNMLSRSGTNNVGSNEQDLDDAATEASFPVYRSETLQDYAMEKYLDRLGIVAVQGDAGVQLKSIDEETRRIELELGRGLKRRISQLVEWKVDLQGRLETLNEGEVALHKLERDRSLNEQTFFKYVQRLEDDRIAGELDRQRIANVAVLTPPSATFQPVYPKKKFLFLVSIVGGLVVAIGLSLVLSYLDDTIRRPRDVSAIEGVEVLGTIRLPKRPTPVEQTEPVGQ